ncbi:uncharacterized protein PV07_05537 [Cladophialophora immunda]|uniref:SnoaL-like domain-containing protein n=1 Tax=Cladophialophora immunda TaxID=569365 RepID=A0A0D2CF63_9EURO|nr:uncharacterized protein PV07_05537 [Cladophialophora immunda]KIW29748.1 hypothetical protein PV07_05537 [Cladophialophora immunda]
MASSTTHLEEQLALTHHINNYGWFADIFAWDDIATCFTEDCTFDFKVAPDLEGQAPMNLNSGTIKGRSDTAKALAFITERFKRTQHNIVNMDFNIDPSNATATGRANIFWGGVTEQNGTHVAVQTGSRYTWKFKKSAERNRWETDYTQVEIVWVSSSPVEGFKLHTKRTEAPKNS